MATPPAPSGWPTQAAAGANEAQTTGAIPSPTASGQAPPGDAVSASGATPSARPVAVPAPHPAFVGEPLPVFLKYAVDEQRREVRTQEDIALKYFEERAARTALARPIAATATRNTIEPDVVPPPQPSEEEERSDTDETGRGSLSPAYDEEDERDDEEAASSDEEDPPRSDPLPLASLTLTVSSENRIAKGSRGSIYAATLNGSAPVAVEIFKNVLSETDMLRFREEILELQNLPLHRCVPRHHGYVVLDQGKQLGIVTQDTSEDQTLQSSLYRSGVRDGVEEVATYGLIFWLLEALAHLHYHDITHGNLKPQHVLVKQDRWGFMPKLVNFGLPTLRTTSGLLHAKAGALGFDPAYASPELLRGEIGYDDVEAWKKSDVFSVTVLIVELLLQQPPWEGELPVYFTKAVRKRGERPFGVDELRVNGERCPELEDIVAKGWHQDPAQRPSVRSLRASLAWALPTSDPALHFARIRTFLIR